MNFEIAKIMYGEGHLTRAYQHIDELQSLNGRIASVIKALDVVDEANYDVQEFRYEDLQNLRNGTLDDTEDELLCASESVMSDRKTSYDSLAVFIGYSAYIASVANELRGKAEKMCRTAISLRTDVPVILESFTKPVVAIITDTPDFRLSPFKSDSDGLNIYDDSAITFEAEMTVKTHTGPETVKLDKQSMFNLVVGSAAIGSYMNFLAAEHSSSRRVHWRRTSEALRSLYTPTDREDDLIGPIETEKT